MFALLINLYLRCNFIRAKAAQTKELLNYKTCFSFIYKSLNMLNYAFSLCYPVMHEARNLIPGQLRTTCPHDGG